MKNENTEISMYPNMDMRIKLFKIDSNTTEDDVNKWLDRTTDRCDIIDIKMQIDNDGYEHILIMYAPKPYDFHDYMVANA